MDDVESLFAGEDGKKSANGEDERRRRSRVKPEDVQASIFPGYAVEVRDLSATGVALQTPQRLELNRSYRLRIRRDQRKVTLSGRVVWCRLATTRRTDNGEVRAFYVAGMSFDNDDHMKHLFRLFYPHLPEPP